MKRATPRPRAAHGVAFRLGALALLPMVLLGIFGGRIIAKSEEVAGASRAVVNAVPELSHLVQLRTALMAERADAELMARAKTMGLGASVARLMLGLDRDATETLRAATDAAAQRLAPGLQDVAALEQLRARVDTTELAPTDVRQGFDTIDRELLAVIEVRLDSLERAIASAGRPALRDTVDTLRSALDAHTAGAARVGDLADYWTVSVDVRPFVLRAVRASADAYLRASAELDRATAPEIVATRARIVEIEAVTDATLYSATDGEEPPLVDGQLDLTYVGQALRRLLPLNELIGSLPLEAAAALERDAADVAHRSDATARLTIAVTVAVLVFVVVAIVIIGQSIARPLRRLTNRARLVGSGDLDVEPLAVRGPSDIALASAAFNDVIANLVLLERKTHALAECSFDDAALAAPMPGRLGEALQRSVRVLSGSINEREGLQRRLVHQATHDPLTGIANRASAVERAGAALARTRRAGEMLGVIHLAVDDIKRVNDTCGHAVGDALLRTLAQRLVAAARAGDFVARIGSDEFLIVAEQVESPVDAGAVARRLIDAIAEPVDVLGHRLNVTASAGVALDSDHVDTVTELFSKASLAADRARQRSGSAVIELFDEALNRDAIARAEIEAALSKTLAAGGAGLVLHYQPIVNAATGRTTGLEALVRWTRADGTFVQPDDFVPVAEASSLIVALDCWVLDAATRQLAAWSDRAELAGVTMAVNVSGRHVVHPAFVDNVAGALQRSGVEPQRLIIEVTETVLLSDLEVAAGALDAVRRLGVQVAVDDFGTGYTSLAHLRQLPIDKIKIDKSFVQRLPDSQEANLIQIVNELARHLGVPTVAEGVETTEHAEVLAGIGCDQLQGYLFSRPLTAPQLEAWAAQRIAT